MLSSFLYILMDDTLSRKLTKGKNDGIILGTKSASGVESINHALFVDDTLLLGETSPRLARFFKEIMKHFCMISGALINNQKSVVYGWNVDPSSMVNISQILGFDGFDSWDKVKYLGLPLTP